jgi:hypothetical protein
VSTSAHGELAIAAGEPFPWVRVALSAMSASGHTVHTWDFERGLADAPLWSPDGTRLIASYADGEGPLPAVVALAADGTRTTLGRGRAPALTADGSIIAASQDRLVKLNGDGRDSTIVQRPGEELDQPQPSPDGTTLAYTAVRGNHFELRTIGIDGHGDRLVLSCVCWQAAPQPSATSPSRRMRRSWHSPPRRRWTIPRIDASSTS